MSIVVMQVFVSLVLVAGSLVLFVFTIRQRDLDHADRLALAPLEQDAPRASTKEKETTPCKSSASSTTTA